MARKNTRGVRASTDEGDLVLGSANCEMILSKEEFDMLQAFHRFVPLPALTSRILRVYCEDDLQVPEVYDDVEEAVNPSSEHGQTTTKGSTSGNILRHPCRPRNLRKKPHFKVNLTSQTPRIQQSRPPSSSDFERSDRPETPE
ncbi:hypothetical protein PPTG_21398 [Phytophthora nicotianae INRA-310]|uniref:Uncharacterized protein n=3 Tax=Phytophthora nicotianae TaxID=4792 RepID=W2R100_PHYN3|nr:hypothetical protein PPTG_21398 [Phytophthora nicotianae INRA-310]ETN19028.1 hypothetical protein PPTG_21398 [Phytophthora nicotianae INRA-310]ETO67747.1 hypothetical protein F444_15355 [Phytophthora nicotianae P1976]KUF90382.1 hypothetical protein AM587_10004355 [Phytophthora nicotianae]